MDSIFVDTRNGKIVKIVTADKVNGLVTLLYIDDKKEKTIEEAEFNQYFSSVEYSNEAHETSQDESNKSSSEKVRKQSKSGNVYYDYETNELVIVDSLGNEVNRLDLTRRGPKGEPGERGSKGEVGDDGPRGPRGDQGDRGERGEQGYRGEMGPQGPKGDQGEPGTKGETGAQGERGEKGEQGIKGETGAPGADGDTWQPRLSPDGNSIYFVNSQGDESPRFAIKGERGEKGDSGIPGAKGERGEQGDTWEPIFTNNNTELFFKNRRTGDVTSSITIKGDTGAQGVQGPQGESAYQIWLNEGYRGDYHDFLLWVAKQAEKGEDGEDGDTYVPHVEKGHLFFISKKTGKRIDGGYVIGPKGPQGEAGLNGHNVIHKYGYKEIKDWTCPVQEINPHLIASSDDLASGSSAEAHMRETLNRINNIRKDGSKKENKGSWIQEWFWWCSGADKKLLRMCPAEHSKYFGIGTVIFFTAFMAFFSSYIAISYVFGGMDASTGDLKWSWLSFGFAFFWAAMIFCLDRFITNTMYSDGKVTISWLELRSALPRILISIFLGIVISAPLELTIFKHEVDVQVKETWESDINSKYQTKLDSCQVLISTYTDSIENIIKLKPRISELKSQRDLAQSALQNKYNRIMSKYSPSRPRNQYANESDESYQRYLNGQTSKNQNISKTAQAELSLQLHGDSIELKNILAQITQLSIGDSIYAVNKKETVQYRDSIMSLMNAQLDSININQAGLYDRLSALHAIAYQGYKPWDWAKRNWWIISIISFAIMLIVSGPFLKNVITPEYDEDGNEIPVSNRMLKGAMVLYPWFAVTAFICGFCCNTLFNALPYYIFTAVGMIMMLFILIDVSPVFYKMMLADGQYEQYLHKEKSITQDLIRLTFAKSIAKVNESEIGRLAPLIFSKPFDKIKKVLKRSVKTPKEELGWIETDNEGNEIRTAREEINNSNRDLFMTVLGMKTAIVESSYQAWYRDMRDAVMGMHKPGFGSDGTGTDEENDNNPPNNPTDPSTTAERETGHHSVDDEPFDRDNYYGERTGTSPDYDASSDDPYPGTPEDILKDEDRNLDSHTGNEIGSDEQNQEVYSEPISSNRDDDELSKNDE